MDTNIKLCRRSGYATLGLLLMATSALAQTDALDIRDSADNPLLYVESTGNVGIGTLTPGSTLTVVGEISSTRGGVRFPDGSIQTTAASAGAIPTGVIVMWSGAVSDIPAGWALCNGTNGTPNLLATFIKGIPSAATNPGGTGGSAIHNHGVGSLAVPPHDHGGFTGGAVGTIVHFDDNSGGTDFDEPADRTHHHSISSSPGADVTGTTESASSEPEFFSLAFIMRL